MGRHGIIQIKALPGGTEEVPGAFLAQHRAAPGVLQTCQRLRREGLLISDLA